MTITLDARALLLALQELERIGQQLPAIAEQVREETLGHAIIGAQANIYNTAPGAYRRTQDYLRGLDARKRVTQQQATITVFNTEDYARAVETGSTGNLLQLQGQALARSNPQGPFTQGRSGAEWFKPGPVITGAQAFAMWRLQSLFAKAVRDAL